MQTAFPHLFEPLQIRGKRLKNRIMSTGHDTVLPTDGTVNAAPFSMFIDGLPMKPATNRLLGFISKKNQADL